MRLENALLLAAGVIAMVLWHASLVSGDSDTPLYIGWFALLAFAIYSVVSGQKKSS